MDTVTSLDATLILQSTAILIEMEERDRLNSYLSTTVGSLLEDMLTALLAEQPHDPAPFLLSWLQTKTSVPLQPSERQELDRLRAAVSAGKPQRPASASEDSEQSQEEDFVDQVQAGKMDQRKGVSSEAFGAYNKKEDFRPRKIDKTESQRQQILDRLSRSFMFAALDESEREIVVLAMEERKYSPGDTVIRQGEDGDVLFVVDSGTLDCVKVLKPGQDPTFLKNYGPGDSFGELALLYNVPRAATITAQTEALLWALDRGCFTHIVKDSAIRKRERYEEFLKNIDLLGDMDPYERSQLSDALRTVTFQDGDYVIREGDWGDVFFIVESGAAKALKALNPGEEPVVVKEYSVGDYFGELALLRGEPRAASVVAVGALSCETLDRHSFKRLLGPLEDILRRNSQKYEEILAKLKSSEV